MMEIDSDTDSESVSVEDLNLVPVSGMFVEWRLELMSTGA